MRRLLLALLAILGQWCVPSAVPASEPCTPGQVLVVRDGLARTSSGEPAELCDGDLYATEDAAALLLDSQLLALERDRARFLREEHALEEEGWRAALKLCQAQERAEHEGRIACEQDRVPPPVVERAWYQSPVFSGVLGAVLGAGVTIAVVYAVR